MKYLSLLFFLSLLSCSLPNRFMNKAEITEGMDNYFPVIRDDDETASIKAKIGASIYSDQPLIGDSRTISDYEQEDDQWGNEQEVLKGRLFGNKDNYTVNYPSYSFDAGIDFNTDSPLGLHGFVNYSKADDLNAFLTGVGASIMATGEKVGGGFYLKGVHNQINYDFEAYDLDSVATDKQSMIIKSTILGRGRSQALFSIGLGATIWLKKLFNSDITSFFNFEINAHGLKYKKTNYEELTLYHFKNSIGIQYPLFESFGVNASFGTNSLENFDDINFMGNISLDYYLKLSDIKNGLSLNRE